MRLEFKFDDKAVMARLRDLEKKAPQKIDTAIKKTALTGIRIILERTQEGMGFKGPFKPYSDKYAKFRAKTGRQIAPVNLNFFGDMLGDISNRPLGVGRQRLYFLRADEAEKAFHNNKTRPFFGFSAKEKTRLKNVFKRSLQL